MNSKENDRAKYLALRRALTPEQVLKLSGAISKRLFALEEYISAASVMAYADILNEVATGEILRRILADGKRLYLPRISEKKIEAVRITDIKAQLSPGTFGVFEPVSSLRAGGAGEIGLVIVPGLAFDGAGNRLGYGKGYYDRFLPKTKCPAAGLAFGLQIATALAHDENDKKIGIIITEGAVIRT